jgi:hypothetical protein
MADSIPWLKSIQSVGRGFRPGMEIKVVSAGKDIGKTMMHVDVESAEYKPWRETFLPHYAEYRDFETGETYWQKFNRLPRSANLYRANNVIRKNIDGTYEYIKNRETGELRQLTEDEIMWVLLHV